MVFENHKPYNDLPALPPLADIETKLILKHTILARSALSELKTVGSLLPNQSILNQAIGLEEAKFSSEIENIVTTNDQLYRAFSNDDNTDDPQTKEVLLYKSALWYGYEEIKLRQRLLTTTLFEEIVSIIKGSDLSIRKTVGTKLANPQSGEVIYIPPEGERLIRDMLGNLEKFIYNQDNIDPLIKLAIVHYQFEAIHPFIDGNGRTGRIINILFLIQQELLDTPTLYLSRYIIENKAEYYSKLRDVTENQNWESWIIFMLKGIAVTASVTSQRVYKIRDLMKMTADKIQEQVPKIYSKDLIEAIFQKPYTKISTLQEMGLGTRQTVKKYLDELERIGVLKSFKAGRDYYFFNQKFYDILSS